MKKLLAILISGTAIAPLSHGLVNLGDEGEITLDVNASLYYDSQVQARSDSDEDVILSIQPALRYTRPSRNFTFSAAVGVGITRYMDSDEFDDENFFFDVSLNPNIEREYSRFVFSGNVNFSSSTESQQDVGDIVTVRNYGANASLLYDPNQKYNIVADTAFNRRDPDSGVYDETDTVSGGLKLQIPVNKSLFAEAGARVQETDSDNDLGDTTDYTYFVGFTGLISAKISGNLSAGIQERDLDSGGSESSPYLSAALNYVIDERTNAGLSATKGFGTTLDSRTSERLSVQLTVSRNLRRDLALSGFAGYSESDYSGSGLFLARKDEEVFIGGRLTYQIVRWGSLGFDVRYSDQSSSVGNFEYSRLRAGLVFQGSW